MKILDSKPWQGVVDAPPSKSQLHRLMIAAWLAGASDEAVVIPGTPSADMIATRRCLNALRDEAPLLDCGESGSTVRFLLPLASALGLRAEFTGSGRLPERPLDDLLDAMAAHGVKHSSRKLPLALEGQLTAGEYSLAGNISSQYLTGLLFALPLLADTSVIRLTTPLQSAGYIDLTIQVLQQFGVEIQRQGDTFVIPGPQRYTMPAPVLYPEGDWSNGAFPLVAGALAGTGLTVRGLRQDSCQGDRAVVSCLRSMGASIEHTGDQCRIQPAPLRGIEIDTRGIPDLVPVLAVAASLAEGTTHFTHAERLRLKESDRLESTCQMICALGGIAETTPDSLVVTGVPQLQGGVVDAAGDHRIAMAAAVAAVRCQNAVSINGAGAVSKSWPDFFQVREAMILS